MKHLCKFILVYGGMLAIFIAGSLSQAATIGNFQSAFRDSGTDLVFTYNFSAWDGGTEVIPSSFTSPGASFREFGVFGGGGGTGLGTIVVDITRSAGASGTETGSFHAFFDLEVVMSPNNTFFDEFAADSGTMGGVDPTSWEIDEPGFMFGDIPFNFEDGTLDNTNGVPVGSPDDVAVAMGWDLSLNAGQTATLTLLVSDTGTRAATSNFFITQTDPKSDVVFTFSGALETRSDDPNGTNPIPEPSTMLLFGTGVIGLAAWRLRMEKKH